MEMTCPICNGAGDIVKCEECDDGMIVITDCPLLYIGNDARQYMRFAKLFERGSMPVGGGVLDQANKFIEIAEFINDQKTINENQVKSND